MNHIHLVLFPIFATSTGASQSPILTHSIYVGGKRMCDPGVPSTQFSSPPLLEIDNASTYVDTSNPGSCAAFRGLGG